MEVCASLLAGPNPSLVDLFRWDTIFDRQECLDVKAIEYFSVDAGHGAMQEAHEVSKGDLASVPSKAPQIDGFRVAASKTKQHDIADARVERFPLHLHGRCDHKAHWVHVRAKRSYSFYKCGWCEVQWRQLRPKVAMKVVQEEGKKSNPRGL